MNRQRRERRTQRHREIDKNIVREEETDREG
jgi:hypothetical protein